MSNAKMSLRIVEENIDPSSKRGIRAVLSDGYEEKEKLINYQNSYDTLLQKKKEIA